MVFIIRQFVETCREWQAPHIFMMDGDIKKAHDYVSHRAFADSA